jgi:FkbM family methyltransferase
MLSGLIDNYDARHLQRINQELKQHGGNKEIIDVSCYKLENILREQNINHIDYLSIDTEGNELAILK